MQKSRASFTVFFEDPFWVGVYEREEPGGLTAVSYTHLTLPTT